MRLKRLLWLLTTLLPLSACVQLPLARPERATPTPTAVLHNPGVVELLRHPPEPGEIVEVDAYFSGAGASPVRTDPPPPPDNVICPTFFTWSTALTDRPFVPMLQLLNGTQSNTLPEDALWLADDPAGLRKGLSNIGFAVEDVRMVAGDIRITLRLPDAPNADGALIPWLLTRGERGWRVQTPEPAIPWPVVG